MDQDEEYSDRRNDLLKRFRESLSKPMSERYFDEDDLLEIFDFAGDINDDYLRMEALMCGARYFPDSEALYQRRGIFYSQYSLDNLVKFVGDNPQLPQDTDMPYGNMIFELLQLRTLNDADEVSKRLDQILQKYDSYSDEEVIQLIGVASSFDLLDWVKNNMEELRKRSQYPNVLLYEVAVAAENASDTALSIPLVEELTEIEPFNSYYWLLLAKQYAVAEDVDKALSAIDYSLAVKPDDAQALYVKAHIMYSAEKDPVQVIDLLKQSIALDNTNTDALRLLAGIYSNDGNDDKASQLLTDALSNAMPEQYLEIVPELVLYNPPGLDRILDQFFDYNEENSPMVWASWVQQLTFFGYHESARQVYQCYERKSHKMLPTLFPIEHSFVNGDFDQTLINIHEYMKSMGTNESDFPSVATMHLLSLVKFGAIKEANEFCDFFLDTINISKYKTLSNRLEFMGLLQIVKMVKIRIDNPVTRYDWDAFDPLNYWGAHPDSNSNA